MLKLRKYEFMRTIKSCCTPGTQITYGDHQYSSLSEIYLQLVNSGFKELSIPVVQPTVLFTKSIYQYTQIPFDHFNSLTPSYLPILEELGKTVFASQTDLPVFYIGKTYKRDAGRVIEDNILGVEYLNYTKTNYPKLMPLCRSLLHFFTITYLGPRYTKIWNALELKLRTGSAEYDSDQRFIWTCSALSNSLLVKGGTHDNCQGFVMRLDNLFKLREQGNHWENTAEECLSAKISLKKLKPVSEGSI